MRKLPKVRTAFVKSTSYDRKTGTKPSASHLDQEQLYPEVLDNNAHKLYLNIIWI
jgi:hypothetical protein